MGRVIHTLNQLEIHLQALVEGSAARLFPRSASSRHLAGLVDEAIQAGLQDGNNGEFIAPNVYYLMLHPDQAAVIQKDTAWIDTFTRTLLDLEGLSEFVFASPPVVRIVASNELEFGEMRVLAEHNREIAGETAGKSVDHKSELDVNGLNGFLIVNGTELFLLDQVVINIGRRSDNQLVLDDGKVSRLHAQIRLIDRNYVIFDLDSAGGTWVNGERIRQRKLIPGDVIAIAGMPLVFGQEVEDQGETTEYRPVHPGDSDKS